MTTCPRCGAEVPANAKFCVMCGLRIEVRTTTGPSATSTLTGSGLVVSLATAALAAGIVIGIVVLVESLL